MYPSFSLCEDAAQDAGVKSSAPFDLETTDTCLHPIAPHPSSPEPPESLIALFGWCTLQFCRLNCHDAGI